jgi:hypothetical protein
MQEQHCQQLNRERLWAAGWVTPMAWAIPLEAGP